LVFSDIPTGDGKTSNLFLQCSFSLERRDGKKMSRNLEDISCKSAVAQFYDNRAIFITGATGFMGKVTWGAKGYRF
jgi:hypothetical protein